MLIELTIPLRSKACKTNLVSKAAGNVFVVDQLFDANFQYETSYKIVIYYALLENDKKISFFWPIYSHDRLAKEVCKRGTFSSKGI